MSSTAIDAPPKGGFNFDLCRRNDMLAKKGLKSPSYLKTGTTIVGLIFEVIGYSCNIDQSYYFSVVFWSQMLFFQTITLSRNFLLVSQYLLMHIHQSVADILCMKKFLNGETS